VRLRVPFACRPEFGRNLRLTFALGAAALLSCAWLAPTRFDPHFTATVIGYSQTNRTIHTVFISSPDDPSSQASRVMLSGDPTPPLWADARISARTTNDHLRLIQFRIHNTGPCPARQSTRRCQWFWGEWLIEGRWHSGYDTAWFFFRDDFIRPGETRDIELWVPAEATAMRLRWLVQPASSRYRTIFAASKIGSLQKPLGRFDITVDEPGMGCVLQSPAIPTIRPPTIGMTFDLTPPTGPDVGM